MYSGKCEDHVSTFCDPSAPCAKVNMPDGDDDAFLRALAKTDIQLTCLGIEFCLFAVADEGICPLVTACCGPQMVHLCLDGNFWMTDAVFEALADVGCGPNLRSLNIRYLPAVTFEGIATLIGAGCGPSLETLVLTEIPFVDEMLQLLANVGCGSHLTHLHIDTWRSEKKVSDSGIQALARAGCGPNLTSLKLSHSSKITDQAFEALAAAGCGPKLTHLRLASLKNVTNAGFASLANARCGPNLETLLLWNMDKDDSGVEALIHAGCGPKLKNFNLPFSKNPLVNDLCQKCYRSPWTCP